MPRENFKVILIGPLAFDYIMNFRDLFINSVEYDNIKYNFKGFFSVDNKIKLYGGTIGNIAYNLGLLNIIEVDLHSVVGSDFNSLGYKKHLSRFENINLNLRIHRNLSTPTCYIVNDKKGNQNIIFYEGAMVDLKDIYFNFELKKPHNFFYSIISALNVNSMLFFIRNLFKLKIPIIFDPGQKTLLFSKKELMGCIIRSDILIGNTFELNLIRKKIDISFRDLIKIIKIIIITKGKNGSELIYANESGEICEIKIPVCTPEKKILDTTGAGDAFRAGLLTGLAQKMSLFDSCSLGSVLASFVVETIGSQTHKYDINDVITRFIVNFGYTPLILDNTSVIDKK